MYPFDPSLQLLAGNSRSVGWSEIENQQGKMLSVLWPDETADSRRCSVSLATSHGE
jgi:hypothetical protein